MGFVFLTKISDEHFIFNRLCLHIMYINTHKHTQYKTQFNQITNTFCKIEDNPLSEMENPKWDLCFTQKFT